MSHQQQRGAALLIVLMVLALVAILATEMGARLQLQVQRASNIKSSNQAYWYALSAEEYARKSLQLLMQESADLIHLNQAWAEQFEFPMEDGGVSVNLEDMRSCFNLNALPNAGETDLTNEDTSEAMEAFATLLSLVDPELPSLTLDTVRDSLADWLDDDDQVREFGAEDSEYTSRVYPYLAANDNMVSQSELRLVNGVEPRWLDKLLPFVCAIPDNEDLLVNVNTLSDEQAPLLAAVTGLSLAQAKALIAVRPQDGWEEASDFLAEPDITALELSSERTQWFAVTTEYFLLHTKSYYNESTFAMSSLFYASSAKTPAVIRREFGVTR